MQIEVSQELKNKEQALAAKILAEVEAFEKDTLLTVSSINLLINTKSTRVGTVIEGREIGFDFKL
jgi:hypothetical protein